MSIRGVRYIRVKQGISRKTWIELSWGCVSSKELKASYQSFHQLRQEACKVGCKHRSSCSLGNGRNQLSCILYEHTVVLGLLVV